MFNNLEEICSALKNIFISKKVSIIKKDNSIIIILLINLIGGKEQKINIKLYNKISNKNRFDYYALLKRNKHLEDIIKIKIKK